MCPLILDLLSFHQIPNDGNRENRLAKGFGIGPANGLMVKMVPFYASFLALPII